MLQENGDTALDLNVEPAWIQGVTGCNVIVGVVDDGKLAKVMSGKLTCVRWSRGWVACLS